MIFLQKQMTAIRRVREAMNHYIYKITNKKNGFYYIGMRSCECSVDEDTGYMGSGFRIKNAIQLLGVEQFEKEILFICNNKKEASEKEAELVTSREVNDPKCYNLVLGGLDGHKKSIEKSRELWKSIDYSVYVDFYNSLEGKSSDELYLLEKSFSPFNLDIPHEDRKFPSDEVRLIIWDMHFRRMLVAFKNNRCSREKIISQYKVSNINIESFLERIM